MKQFENLHKVTGTRIHSKNQQLFYLLVGVFLLAITFAACEKNNNDPSNPNNPVSDPEGTITANISETTYIYFGTSVYNTGYIGWLKPDNFYLCGDKYLRINKVSICELGLVNGLGSITNIPQTGYTIPALENSTVACESKNGYVAKLELLVEDGIILSKYVRLYVVEPIVSTLGGIMGAKVKYQYPFNAAKLNISPKIDYIPYEGATGFITVNTDDPQWIGGAYPSNLVTLIREENGLRLIAKEYSGTPVIWQNSKRLG